MAFGSEFNDDASTISRLNSPDKNTKRNNAAANGGVVVNKFIPLDPNEELIHVDQLVLEEGSKYTGQIKKVAKN